MQLNYTMHSLDGARSLNEYELQSENAVIDVLETKLRYFDHVSESSVKQNIRYDFYTRPISQISTQCEYTKTEFLDELSKAEAELKSIPITGTTDKFRRSAIGLLIVWSVCLNSVYLIGLVCILVCPIAHVFWQLGVFNQLTTVINRLKDSEFLMKQTLATINQC